MQEWVETQLKKHVSVSAQTQFICPQSGVMTLFDDILKIHFFTANFFTMNE
jgi:hypothetical protein